MDTINSIIDFEFLKIGKYSLTMGSILFVVFTIIFTNLILWIVKRIIFRNKKLTRFEDGNLHSLFQIIKYVIWILAILLILDTIGLKLNVVLAGSAALLVGIGLGLQNTFNDFISGIILLFEGSIKVGDILEIDNDIVKIQKIGMRTSEAMNRDDIVTILPNSLITTNKVINWSHQSKKTRFRINVGVAYGSNVELVIELLKKSALEHPQIKDEASIQVRFVNFGNSSLDFELLFYSKNIFRIENVKSEIRIIINRKFIENNITIPFPQIDLHLKSNNTELLTK
ncbi:mechanosensitive ion channel family protein [Ancylomarina sp. 16SWW S1-10-2]|uniref:mechanosensitive ion channel family protein n=1 Tax=Ancylomarina sp. 16SWW S1-10-2 TaxID=2499681 RepID=UPI0012AE4119|nr:mechanosensitive ion channel domain-containing protein [Ancylomarina sp. 16SWW S1-10-2]MRT94684.1 mechanosensitive ion channel [Ancylomarina sp. 16SWW S1-10-2]